MNWWAYRLPRSVISRSRWHSFIRNLLSFGELCDPLFHGVFFTNPRSFFSLSKWCFEIAIKPEYIGASLMFTQTELNWCHPFWQKISICCIDSLAGTSGRFTVAMDQLKCPLPRSALYAMPLLVDQWAITFFYHLVSTRFPWSSIPNRPVNITINVHSRRTFISPPFLSNVSRGSFSIFGSLDVSGICAFRSMWYTIEPICEPPTEQPRLRISIVSDVHAPWNPLLPVFIECTLRSNRDKVVVEVVFGLRMPAISGRTQRYRTREWRFHRRLWIPKEPSNLNEHKSLLTSI